MSGDGVQDLCAAFTAFSTVHLCWEKLLPLGISCLECFPPGAHDEEIKTMTQSYRETGGEIRGCILGLQKLDSMCPILKFFHKTLEDILVIKKVFIT